MKKFITVLIMLAIFAAAFSVLVFAEEADGSAVAETNVFEIIYKAAVKHADKILAALAFVGSLILAFVYKKGVLPLLKNGLAAIGTATGKMQEENEKTYELCKENLDLALERLKESDAILVDTSKRLAAVGQELLYLLKEQAQSSEIKLILEAQIDMLYEIFMSSSIPLYQKESVGERISGMKKLLSKGEESGNE